MRMTSSLAAPQWMALVTSRVNGGEAGIVLADADAVQVDDCAELGLVDAQEGDGVLGGGGEGCAVPEVVALLVGDAGGIAELVEVGLRDEALADLVGEQFAALVLIDVRECGDGGVGQAGDGNFVRIGGGQGVRGDAVGDVPLAVEREGGAVVRLGGGEGQGGGGGERESGKVRMRIRNSWMVLLKKISGHAGRLVFCLPCGWNDQAGGVMRTAVREHLGIPPLRWGQLPSAV